MFGGISQEHTWLPGFMCKRGKDVVPPRGEFIGNGACGEVFALAGSTDMVVKVSNHPGEADVCERLRDEGQHLEHVVRIYDVVRKLGKIYVVMERLRPDLPTYKGGTLGYAADNVYHMNRCGGCWPDVGASMQRDVHNNSRGYHSYCGNNVHSCVNVQCYRQMCDIMLGIQELASLGIEHNDLHGGNVLLNAYGRVKLIDFTYTSSTGA